MTYVLVVDDDSEIRECLCMLLQDEGFRVLEAENGEVALDILTRSPDRLIVLLDQMMPRLDGLGVLQAVAANALMSERHAFILVSAERFNTDGLAALPARMVVRRLRKPFELDHILAAVASAAVSISIP